MRLTTAILCGVADMEPQAPTIDAPQRLRLATCDTTKMRRPDTTTPSTASAQTSTRQIIPLPSPLPYSGPLAHRRAPLNSIAIHAGLPYS